MEFFKSKTMLIIFAVLIAIGIAYFVWKNNTNQKKTYEELSPRVKELVDRVPIDVRQKIVAGYNQQLQSGDKLELRDGIVFNVTKNEADQWERTTIEAYIFGGVLWALKTKGDIDGSTEWWLKKTKAYKLSEYIESINIK